MNEEEQLKKITKPNLDHVPKYIISILVKLFSNIAREQNLTIQNITYETSGSITTVYCLGNKVLKIGLERLYNYIPQSSYILQPIYRNNFQYENETLYVEIADYIPNPTTMEDAYFVYQNLRNDNIVWLDCKPDNLKKTKDGKLLIVDLDLLIPENQLDLEKWRHKINLPYYKMFEKRYQIEQEKIKKYIKL